MEDIKELATKAKNYLDDTVNIEHHLSNQQMRDILELLGVRQYQKDALASEFTTKHNSSKDDYLIDAPQHRKYYELNGDNQCPRCLNGIIIQDIHDKVCLCCGLRDYGEISLAEFTEEVLINWLIDNKPRQLFTPPNIY